MRFHFGVALFTLTRLISSTSSQSLGTLTCNDYWVSIRNQTQLDFYSTCSIFESPVFVGHEFSGAFELPGIVSVGRVSAGYLLPKLTGSKRDDDAVTSISFPDLENTTETYFGGIMAAYLEYLTDVSFPKVENITGDLVLLSNPQLKSADFPALKNVSGGVLIDGHFDEISFPSLQKVGFMNIISTGDIDCVALGKTLTSLVFTETVKPFGGDLGFTCRNLKKNNKWNSSDPDQNTQATGSSSSASASASASGSSSRSASTSPTGTSAGNAGNAFTVPNIGSVNVVLALVGITLVGRWL